MFFCLVLILNGNQLYCLRYTHLTQKSSVFSFSSNGLVTDIAAYLVNGRRTNFSSGKNIIPFVEPAVDFNAVKIAVQKHGDIPKSLPQVQSFCDGYFGGNAADLRRVFDQTGFSTGFFGIFSKLHQMKYYPKYGKSPRFQKRSLSCIANVEQLSGDNAVIRSCSDVIPENLNRTDNLPEKLKHLKKYADFYRLGKLKIPAFVFDLQRDLFGKMIVDLTSSTDDHSSYIGYVENVLSMSDNTPGSYFESDLQNYLNGIEHNLGKAKKDRYGASRRFCVMPEVYGVPFCVTYKMGLLQSASARNFRTYDKDITDLLRVIQGVPSVTCEKEETTFDGSLFLSKKDFHILNAQRIVNGKSAWLDPLQAINFAINSQEPLRVLDGRLRAIFYNENNSLNYMQEQGFAVVTRNSSFIDSADVCRSYVKRYTEELPFMVSGIQFLLGDKSEQQLIKSPNSYIFKIAPDFYEATVESVDFKAQYTGIITTILNIQSLEIYGKHFTKLILANKTDFEEFDIGAKDKLVLYSYSGAEPRIFTVLKSENSKKLLFPSQCPKCASPLKYDVVEGKQVACCAAHMECVDDSIKDIGHFFSKYGLYVASLSDRVIDELIKTSTVSSITDVLNLSVADWQSVESVSQDEFSKIINQIKTAKNTTLARFLYALDIPMVSYVAAEKLARFAGSIDRLKTLSLSDLIQSGDTTKEVARNVSRFFSDEKKYGKSDKLLKLISIAQVSQEIVAMCYKKDHEQSDYLTIIDKIRKCDEGNDTVSDYEYDLLLETAHNIETLNPKWTLPIATHRNRDLVQWQDSLKLRKTYSRSELLEFCEDHPEGLVVEPKVNGLSCALKYDRGVLNAAFTSAAHIEGSGFNIRDFINDVRHIPKQLKLPFSGTVRGELFLSKSAISRINDARINSGLQPYVDALSAMGPLTKSKKRKLQHDELYNEIEFFSYHLVCDTQEDKTGFFELATRLDASNFMHKLGFQYHIKTPKVFYSANEAEHYASNEEARRYDFPFDIDGMVVKSLDWFAEDEQKNLKYTPDMIGYKFQLQRLKTTLKSVQFSTNQGGVVLASAELDPVKASNGRLISRVSIRNINILSNVREGDTVFVDYAGGVSPILKSIDAAKKVTASKAPLIEIPKICPVCKAKLQKKSDSMQCINPVCFGSAASKSLQNFASAIGIAKEKSIEKLIDRGIVKKYSDFYRLLPEDLNEGVSITALDSVKILASIENSKKTTFGRLLKALKIPGLGSESIEIIVREVKTFKSLLELTKQDVQNNKYSRKILEKVLLYVDNNRDELQYLLQSGVASQVKQNTNKLAANTPMDVDGIYSLYNAQELELAGSVNGVLEKIKRMNSERHEFLTLLAKAANKNSKSLRLEKLLRAAENRDSRLLSEPIRKFLIAQKKL